MDKILFLESDVEYRQVIEALLKNEGYLVDVVENAAEALDLIKEKSYNLVLTALEIGAIDGIQFVEFLRESEYETRIFMLSKEGTDIEELRALELGVHDFVSKKTSLQILLKRISNVLSFPIQLCKKTVSLESKIEDLRLELERRRVFQNEELIEVTVKEFDLLAFFLKNKNRVIPREEFINSVWSKEKEKVDFRTVDTHVKKLRSKMDIESIMSIRGIGYEWNE